MHLTSQQEKALGGEEGEASQLAMEILTKVGDAVSADSLVPIKSAHVLAHYSSLHEAGIEMLERFADRGGKFAVPTTVDPASVDLENWRDYGIPEGYATKQSRLCSAYGRMGGIPCWTCVQYQVCNFPKRGENVAWAESSSVVFANSLIGCRTNKITSGLDMACAVTGLTPRFGMLLDENRIARIGFRLSSARPSELDFRSIGYFIGKESGSRVPALVGLPADVSSDELKHLGAAAASSGPVTMVHYVGLTPGSQSAREAAAGEDLEMVDITRRDLDEVKEDLNQTSEPPDLAAFGVPHLSATEMGLLAKALAGRQVRPGARMIVYTSAQALEMATRSGIRAEIEASGALISSGTDGEISPLSIMGVKVAMTNSAKMAEIVSAEGDVRMRYGSTKEILEEVTA